MNKLIISLLAVLATGCATNTDYIKPTDEPKSDYVQSPARITPGAGPTVSAMGIKDKEYLPVEVEEIPPLTFDKPEETVDF